MKENPQIVFQLPVLFIVSKDFCGHVPLSGEGNERGETLKYLRTELQTYFQLDERYLTVKTRSDGKQTGFESDVYYVRKQLIAAGLLTGINHSSWDITDKGREFLRDNLINRMRIQLSSEGFVNFMLENPRDNSSLFFQVVRMLDGDALSTIVKENESIEGVFVAAWKQIKLSRLDDFLLNNEETIRLATGWNINIPSDSTIPV